MTANKRILVVIDPTAASHPALERGAWLARRLSAALDLFICAYDPHLEDRDFVDPGAIEKARASLLENHTRKLRELVKCPAAEGLAVTVDARWDYPLHEGIVRKTLDCKADIVVKDTHYHSILKRSILSNTDWNLIRTCPAALWLVKPRAPGVRPCVVAAVDPLHERDKPAELDHKILMTAKELCSALAGEVHVFHAFDIAPVLAVSTNSMTMPISLPIQELTDSLKQEHAEALYSLTDSYTIERSKVHMHQGGTRELLVALTDQLRADLVVMGAVSRGRLQRLFLGSTAEDVLDRLSCDVLIVKPNCFEEGHDH
jgi:universal stress protein E